MSNLQQALQSADFQKAGSVDQMKYLAAVDPDFASASSEDKLAYLNHVTGKPAPTTANNSVENNVSQSHPEGFLNAAFNDVKALGSGILNAGSFDPGKAVKQGTELAMDYAQRKQEGRSPIYNAAATAVSGTGLMNTRPMEEAGNHGDAAGVVGHTVVPVATAIAPLAAEGAMRVGAPAIQRIARGPGGYGPVKLPLPNVMRIPGIERELEAAIPRNEPPTARSEMYNDLGSRILRRGKEQAAEPTTPSGVPIDQRVAGARSLILTPSEALAEKNMSAIATKRASERGMFFAGGMTPREGRSVPRMPTQIQETEFGGPREHQAFPIEDDDEEK